MGSAPMALLQSTYQTFDSVYCSCRNPNSDVGTRVSATVGVLNLRVPASGGSHIDWKSLGNPPEKLPAGCRQNAAMLVARAIPSYPISSINQVKVVCEPMKQLEQRIDYSSTISRFSLFPPSKRKRSASSKAVRCQIVCSVSIPSSDSAQGNATSTVKRPWQTSDARLVLEDGSIWRAKSFGALGTQVGEVVFNTSMTGYQEILTDPSYAGQFVLMTNPHIGNTGVNIADEESNQCFLAGLVIRSLSASISNWRSTESLPAYLAKRNVMGIYDVDTRAITRRLREDGSLIGVLSTDASRTDDELLNMSRTWDIVGVDLITGVTCSQPYEWKAATNADWEFSANVKDSNRLHVVAYDFGIKHNILRRLASYGCKITVVPSTWPASGVLKLNPDGVLFSNGPGDPSAVPYAVENVKEVLGKVPVFGICMGHQLLGQALGGKTFKMKFGHHGGNHPVRNLRNGRVEISAQNHNYAVDPATLPEGAEVTHINLNDGTCAGLSVRALNIMSLQYHPEASPGPHDSDPVFHEFVQLMRQSKQKCL